MTEPTPLARQPGEASLGRIRLPDTFVPARDRRTVLTPARSTDPSRPPSAPAAACRQPT